MAQSDQLRVPEAARTDAKSFELLRVWIAHQDRAGLGSSGGDLDWHAAGGDDGRIRLLGVGHSRIQVTDVEHNTGGAGIGVCGSRGLAFETLEMGKLE